MKRKASARWTGGLKNGSGALSTGSKALSDMKYSFISRFEDGPGTNPEELVAAAHAGCFSMALAAQLAAAGHEPTSIETAATLTVEKQDAGWAVTGIHLEVVGRVPGLDEARFREAAEGARKGCLISRLLRAEVTMDASLVS